MTRRAAPIAAVALAALGIGGCNPDAANRLRPPMIVAEPPSLSSGGRERRFAATLDAGDGAFEITAVELQLARDRDPARATPGERLRFLVAPTPVASGPLALDLPPAIGFVTAQLVTFEWVVEYRSRGGGRSELASSGAQLFRVDCPGDSTRDFLRDLQRRVRDAATFPQALAGPPDVARLAALGYNATHGWRSFPGMGVAFFRLAHGSLTPRASLDADWPTLLLYAPRAGAASVTDTTGPDFPYALIGFGFARAYAPGAPPGLGCLPREAWFVHEAGWHLSNGGFSPDRPAESTLGAVAPGRTSSPPPIARPGRGSVPPWHGRLWDVHLFIDVAAGVPIVAPCFNAPARQPDFFPDLSTCTPRPGGTLFPESGTVFPAAGFFVPPAPPP